MRAVEVLVTGAVFWVMALAVGWSSARQSSRVRSAGLRKWDAIEA